MAGQSETRQNEGHGPLNCRRRQTPCSESVELWPTYHASEHVFSAPRNEGIAQSGGGGGGGSNGDEANGGGSQDEDSYDEGEEEEDGELELKAEVKKEKKNDYTTLSESKTSS